jgi:hypothetical protein
MSRLFRYSLNAAAGLSLVLSIVTVMLWVRSYCTWDMIIRNQETPHRLLIESSHGRIVVCRSRADFWPWAESKSTEWRTYQRPEELGGGKLGVSVTRQVQTVRVGNPIVLDMFVGIEFHTTAVSVPYWLATKVALVFPGLWLVGAIRTRRRISGANCRRCGYDLRATPDRCPECGTVPTRKSDAQPRA